MVASTHKAYVSGVETAHDAYGNPHASRAVWGDKHQRFLHKILQTCIKFATLKLCTAFLTNTWILIPALLRICGFQAEACHTCSCHPICMFPLAAKVDEQPFRCGCVYFVGFTTFVFAQLMLSTTSEMVIVIGLCCLLLVKRFSNATSRCVLDSESG